MIGASRIDSIKLAIKIWHLQKEFMTVDEISEITKMPPSIVANIVKYTEEKFYQNVKLKPSLFDISKTIKSESMSTSIKINKTKKSLIKKYKILNMLFILSVVMISAMFMI